MTDIIVTHRTNCIYAGKKLRLVEEQVSQGRERSWIHLTLEHPGAVVILPLTAQGELMMVRQYRQSVRRAILEFPAGTLEPGEQPLRCAAREIQEEVGMAAATWADLGTVYPAPGFCNEVQHFFLAEDLSESRLAMDDDEIIEPVVVRPAEFKTLVERGEIQDGKSLAIFLRALWHSPKLSTLLTK